MAIRSMYTKVEKSVEAHRSSYLRGAIRDWRLPLCCILGAGVLFWRLGSGSLDDWDEAIYAQVSKEMVHNNNWLTPYWGYKPFFEKPPLFMWITAIFFKVFGITEFWARAVSALCGIGVLIITFLIARIRYDRHVALLAVLILLTSFQFVASARFGTTDMMLTLFIYLAIYGYLRFENGSPRWIYLVWVASALAVMTKSVSGLVAPMVIALAFLFDKRLKEVVCLKDFWLGAMIALLIVAPWHILMLVEHGRAFTDNYIGYHVIARAVSTLNEHDGSRLYYIDRLYKYFYPWVYLTPLALILSIRENLKGQTRSRLFLTFILLVFLLYTAAQTKLRWYILPLYPALAILVASMLISAYRSHRSWAFSGIALAAFLFILILPLKVVIVFGCAIFTVILFYLISKKPPYKLATILFIALLALVGLHRIDPLFRIEPAPVAKLARFAAADSDHLPLIVYSGLFRPSALFYSDRVVQVAYTEEDLLQWTGDDQPRDIILARADIEPLTRSYEIYPLREADAFVYATIKR